MGHKKNLLVIGILVTWGCSPLTIIPKEEIEAVRRETIFSAEFDRVWKAVTEALHEMRFVVATADKENGIISTGTLILQKEERTGYAAEVYRNVYKPAGPKNIVNFEITLKCFVHPLDEAKNRVKVNAHIVAYDLAKIERKTYVTRGKIEKELFDRVSKILKLE